MRLVVKSFACIDHIDVEFGDYTIFIGEQASGKSVTCKLYFFLRDTLSKRLVSSFVEEEGWRHFQTKTKEGFYSIFPEYSWKNTDFSICLYENGKTPIVTIEYRKGKKSPVFIYSDIFKNRYKAVKINYDKIQREIEKSRKSNSEEMPFFEREYSSMQVFRRAYLASGFDNFIEDVTYIPSGRAFFSVIRDNVFGFLSENIGIDPFLKSFGKFYEYSKRATTTRRTVKRIDLTEFDALSASILKGEYVSEKREDWLIADGKRIQVSSASSGQQEALPMLLGLRAIIANPLSLWKRSVVVEEPEAHLFPSSQKAVVELLFLASRLGANSKFIITTHSPYVLSCVNNELLRSQTGQKVNVSAYYLARGKAHNIIDKSTGLIDGSELDRISSEISNEFYSMLESVK